MSEEEPFSMNVLPDISPFSIDFASLVIQDHVSRDGIPYKRYMVSALGKGLPKSIRVSLFRRDFEKLRILHYMGFSEFDATFGMVPVEGGFAPIIFSPAKSK